VAWILDIIRVHSFSLGAVPFLYNPTDVRLTSALPESDKNDAEPLWNPFSMHHLLVGHKRDGMLLRKLPLVSPSRHLESESISRACLVQIEILSVTHSGLGKEPPFIQSLWCN
jgi:hypothetical protein